MTTITATYNLQDRLDGSMLVPGDAGYDEARTVWNAMVDHWPRTIVRCASLADVVAAVRFAREQDLEIGVRCGGHNIAGLSVPDDGLMIDLRPLCGVRVDAARRRAWVQGGALLGSLDTAAQRHGLATTAGNVSHTGVGGLTLGGGMGWLARRHGLTCDNVVSFALVTADGDVVRASADEHPELFWGLRGGGGNFGIVTEFEFRLHPVGTQTLVAERSFPLAEGDAALRGWRDLAQHAPRQATFTATITDEHVRLGYVWIGDPTRGRQLLPGLRGLGRAVDEQIAEPSYVQLQRRDDTVQGHSVRRYWKGHYLQALPDAAIAVLVARGGLSAGGLGAPAVSLQAYGGAITDVADDATAFSHRATQFEYVASMSWTDPDEDRTRMDAARRCAAALDPFAHGAYVNALSDEGVHGVRRAYTPAKLDRLTALKGAYDPTNVFHLNHNIAPTGR